MTDKQIKAKELSEQFLTEEQQYRLGFVEAEQSNDKTRTLGEDFVTSTRKGIKTLYNVDEALCGLFDTTLESDSFRVFSNDVYNTLKNGGKIIISGCGSSGRLAMRIEASFRIAVEKIAEKDNNAKKYIDSVKALMTGGDYAIIRAVESFEDYIQLGEMQARELNLCSKDILVGVTATAETTSVLGSAKQALADGAGVWMIVCTDPKSIMGKLERADVVYSNKKCKSLYMNCGGMAVTGSTRMQSSTIEQAAISAALELALSKIFNDSSKIDEKYLSAGFKKCVELLGEESTVKAMETQIEKEKALYENDGYVTYFADEYLLDVLADTTERGPTFSTPAFRPQSRRDLPKSLAFVKNPVCNTKKAWTRCFERLPRCIDKTGEEYEKIGIKTDDIKRIPKIDLDALYEYQIGNEPDAERETGNSLATWIGFGEDVPREFEEIGERYKDITVISLDGKEKISPTRLKMFEHLAMKMMINTFSTGTMAKMGRVRGNYMVYISISNKKLVDRATRIISDLCNISYEQANYELFYTKLCLEEEKKDGMVAVETINRLNRNEVK